MSHVDLFFSVADCQVGDQIFLKADTIYTIPRPQEPGTPRMLGHDVDGNRAWV